MNKFLCRFLFLALLFGTSLVCADTITLKSGEKVEGKILRESTIDVTVEVKISAAVTDERVISKDEVESIERLTEDDIAFGEIKNIKPDPSSSLAAATYEQIVTRLKSFQDNFPGSPHRADVQTALDAFEAEKTRVDAGEVKFRGAWLSKEEAEKVKTQIEAEQLFAAMKVQGARGDFSGALNTFVRIEKDGKGAAVFPDAVDFAKQVLASMLAQVDRALAVRTQSDADFKRLLDLSTDEKKTELMGIAKREQDQFDAVLAAAQKTGAKWMPLIPRSRKSLESLRQTIPGEITRLASIPVQKMRDSNALIEQAKAAIAAKDLTTAESLVKEATTLWSDSEGAKRLTETLTAAKAAATPVPTATPKNITSAAAEAAKTPAPSEKPFFLTIPGAMTIVGVVILIAGGLALMGRVKKPTDEVPK